MFSLFLSTITFNWQTPTRCAKRKELETRKRKLAASNCGSADMWRELRKLNPMSRNLPTAVDDACSSSEIADVFARKYESLYNSVPTSNTELDEVRSLIMSDINDRNDTIDFSVQVIAKCVGKLKAGKRDGGQGFDSDHLINGSRKLFHMLRLLFNAMIVHGYTAKDLLHSTIVSIPKNMRSSLCSS